VGRLQLHPKEAMALAVSYNLAFIPARHGYKSAVSLAVAPGVVLDLAHLSPMAVALQDARPDGSFPIRRVVFQVNGTLQT
jgi:hypothetical protein